MNKFLFAFLSACILFSSAYAAGTVVVNSIYWEDILSGSIYAASVGDNYLFLLTPAHADYVASYLADSGAKVSYFESGWPVSSDFAAKMAPLANKGLLSSETSTSLAPLFAAKAPKDSAIIVGRDYGAEALSIAPYAALTDSAVFFAAPGTVNSIASSAKESYGSVLVYGSVASFLDSMEGLEVVNTGSQYSDNLAAAQMFLDAQGTPAKQANLLSGIAFEKSMVGKNYPIILTDNAADQSKIASFLSSNGIKTLIVFQGDADISDAVALLKEKSSVSAFAKLGEGYPHDSLMRDLAVLQIPTNVATPLILVNSKSWEDVIEGASYAAANGLSYAFVLTAEHGDYLANYLASSSGDILYYEGQSPAYGQFYSKLSSLVGGRVLSYSKEPDLASFFASKAKCGTAIVVGNKVGAEALSIAPYAALTDCPIYFAESSNVDSVVATAKSKFENVLVYGSVASSLGSTDGVEVVNSGSMYADNKVAMGMFFDSAEQSPSQVALASGRVFEKSMVSREYPIMLVGRDYAYPDSSILVSERGVKHAVVFQGDYGIFGALDSVKEISGATIFAKLGEGFSGDAAMRDLAMLGLPYPLVELDLSGPDYIKAKGSFELGVQNKGSAPAFVRATVTLPSGQSSSSEVLEVSPGQELLVDVQMAVPEGLAVPEAMFKVEYGQDKLLLDNSDSINYTNIRVVGKIAPAQQPPAQPPIRAEEPESGNSLLLVLLVALVLAGGAYFFLSAGGKPKSKK